jgi:hypothetical protein
MSFLKLSNTRFLLSTRQWHRTKCRQIVRVDANIIHFGTFLQIHCQESFAKQSGFLLARLIYILSTSYAVVCSYASLSF